MNVCVIKVSRNNNHQSLQLITEIVRDVVYILIYFIILLINYF